MTTTNTTHTPTTPSTFVPVKVTGGRKFRGRGFVVNVRTYTGDYGWKQVAGFGGLCHWERNVVETEVARIWDPVAKRFGYANNAYVVADDTVTDAEAATQFAAYCEHIVHDTIEWCRTKVAPGSSETEVYRFARNVIRKNHPEINVDDYIRDQRDLATEIDGTIRWALTLKTQAVFLYGRWRGGNKPLPPERVVKVAYRALEKKGVADMPGFAAAWQAALKRFDLPL
jgi:hypothetical protein